MSVNKENLMLHLSIKRLWKLGFRLIHLYHKHSGKHEANEKIFKFTWLFWISIIYQKTLASHGLLDIHVLRIPDLIRIISRVGWSENKSTVRTRILQVLLLAYVKKQQFRFKCTADALQFHTAISAVWASLTSQHELFCSVLISFRVPYIISVSQVLPPRNGDRASVLETR